MSDTKKINMSQSLDELIVRTIGLVETLPDRIAQIENNLHGLELKFANHEGEQLQGIKRVVDKIEHYNEEFEKIKNSIQQLKEDASRISADDRKALESLKLIVDDLDKDFKNRQETKKNMWEYLKIATQSGIRYAMLPITIILLVFLGFNPDFIPWYNPKPVVHHQSQFEDVLIDIISFVQNNKIEETDIRPFMYQHKKLFIVSYNSNLDDAIRENVGVDKEHFFIWLPSNGQTGAFKAYNENSKVIYSVEVVRR